MADERNEDRIAPVALPAGSFDIQKLQKELDKAVSVENREQHPERINKAIAKTIEIPEILANVGKPPIPDGAVMTEQEMVYREGDEPVKRKVPAFKGVEAESGQEASRMRYDQRTGDATDEPVGVPVVDEDAPLTLTDAAADVAEPDTGKASTKDK